MAPLNSAALVVVNAVNRRQGAVFSLALQNVIGGPYRLALHQIGNCNSPNGFSAGNAWAPPGSTVPPEEVFPVFFVDMQGPTNLNFYVPGVSVDEPGSLLGRTIVLHQGTVIREAFPGQPNNRVACGVFAPPGASFLNRP